VTPKGLIKLLEETILLELNELFEPEAENEVEFVILLRHESNDENVGEDVEAPKGVEAKELNTTTIFEPYLLPI